MIGAQPTISTIRLGEVKLWPFKDLSQTFRKIRGIAGIDAQSDLYPPYHHTSGRPFETYNSATPNSPKTGLKTLEKLARGAQAKTYSERLRENLALGNTARCLLFCKLPHYPYMPYTV